MTHMVQVEIPLEFDEDGPFFIFSQIEVNRDFPLSTEEKQDLIHQLSGESFLRAVATQLGVVLP